MKLSIVLALAITALGLAACSGSDGEIAVDAASTPLTAQGGDALFTVRIVDARADGYALAGLVVKATPDGKDAISLSCTPADANGNGKLDKGETIACTEGTTNELGVDLAGKKIEVDVFATIDGSETKVGSATWTPPTP